MRVLISVETVHDKFLIKFKGTKIQFNEYISKINKVSNKKWSKEHGGWLVDKNGLDYIQKLFKFIEYLDEIKQSDTQVSQKFEPIKLSSIGSSMKLKPYEYQKEAIAFGLCQNEMLICFPCGSGKSAIGIGLFLEAKKRGIIKGPGMIVVKASLKTQWKKEVEKFSTLSVTIIRTPADCKNRKGVVFEEQFNGYDLFILNYETLRNQEVKKALHKAHVDFIFADEIHYIKSKDAARSKAMYEFCEAKMKIGATATPVGKNPEDLYGIFKFIKPTLFPSWGRFASLYIRYAGYGKIAGFKNLDHLQKKIDPYIILKTKEEIGEQLPSLLVMQRYCDLTEEQENMTKQISEELSALKDEEASIRSACKTETDVKNNPSLLMLEAKILALQTFAQEIADSPRLLLESSSEMAKRYTCGTESGKLNLLRDLLEELLGAGEKVAIFSRFERMQAILTELIHSIDKNAKIAYVNGSIKDADRYEEVYTKFRDNDEYKVLLLTDAGAEGLNLSYCRYIIEYDLAESYAIQTQRHGRIERADSIHKTVFVYQLIANNSWDEIQQKIVSKKESYDSELIKSVSSKSNLWR